VLATDAAAMALAAVVAGVARAAVADARTTARTTEPQSRPQEGRVLASLNGTWDFMPATGTPSAPPTTGARPPSGHRDAARRGDGQGREQKADFRIASGSPVIAHSAQATISGAGSSP
jgi:hypothetical protein